MFGPGCLVCPWAAARPRDRHTRACGSERSISKPCQAPPPPMGPQPGPPVPPVPFTPVGLVTLMGGSARRLVVRPSPTAAHGPAARPCRPGGRLSETGVAFAHVWLCGVETGIAFACEKWVFLVRFLGAVVMPVSAVRCWGCAVVLLVSMSPWCRVWCARKFARRRCVIAKVRKSSPSALNLAQLQRFCACWRVFSRGCRWRGCAGRASSRQMALRRSWMRCGALQGGCGWGVCAMRSPLAACRRRVGGLDGVIPPCGGEAALLDANRPILHVIPLSLFQDLNWCRWNCNDSGYC